MEHDGEAAHHRFFAQLVVMTRALDCGVVPGLNTKQ